MLAVGACFGFKKLIRRPIFTIESVLPFGRAEWEYLVTHTIRRSAYFYPHPSDVRARTRHSPIGHRGRAAMETRITRIRPRDPPDCRVRTDGPFQSPSGQRPAAASCPGRHALARTPP